VTELAQLLQSIEATPVSEEEFQEAAEAVKKYKLENDQKLQLYGLYKQSTVQQH
jgi:acyl-CoA-binding protein